jgi:HlyD family secretion protein
MFRLLKNPIVLIAVVLAAGGTFVWRWHVRNSNRLSFTTSVVKRGDMAATIGATGTIEPLETVDVGAQVAGRVSVFGKDQDGTTVDYGSVVREGSLLAKIDDSVYAADLSVAKAGQLSADANLEQMNAKLDQAAADWKRAQELFANKLISQVDYDTAKANLLNDANAKALSFPILDVGMQGARVVISWTGPGTLQAASSLLGPWSDVASATNRVIIAPGAGPGQQHYRLRP